MDAPRYAKVIRKEYPLLNATEMRHRHLVILVIEDRTKEKMGWVDVGLMCALFSEAPKKVCQRVLLLLASSPVSIGLVARPSGDVTAGRFARIGG